MMMSVTLMPGWIQGAARFNPVNWAVVAARDGFEGRAWTELALHLGFLALFALLCAVLATGAFGRYRRSS
jgi:ABC-2 type transport system permease protein